MDSNSENQLSAIDFASEEMKAKAKARGESLGFTGAFFSNFIERELVFMEKWARRPVDKKPDDIQPRDYLPWGGIFENKIK